MTNITINLANPSTHAVAVKDMPVGTAFQHRNPKKQGRIYIKTEVVRGDGRIGCVSLDNLTTNDNMFWAIGSVQHNVVSLDAITVDASVVAAAPVSPEDILRDKCSELLSDAEYEYDNTLLQVDNAIIVYLTTGVVNDFTGDYSNISVSAFRSLCDAKDIA